LELAEEGKGTLRTCWLVGGGRDITLRRAAGNRQPGGRRSVRHRHSVLDMREENWEIDEKCNGVAKAKHWSRVMDEEGPSYVDDSRVRRMLTTT